LYLKEEIDCAGQQVSSLRSSLDDMASSAPSEIAGHTETDASYLSELEFQKWLETNGITGAVTVVMKDGRDNFADHQLLGKIVWQKALGKADIENNVPMTVNHIFRMASISKVTKNSVSYHSGLHGYCVVYSF
jgi:CubicO group peptidase (beta-lactamase class C family)